jgi:ankyrin repeat protein
MSELHSQTQSILESASNEKSDHTLVSLPNQQPPQHVLPSVVSKTSSDHSKQPYEIWHHCVAFDETHAAEESLIRLTLNVNDRGIPIPRQRVGGESKLDNADATVVYDWDSLSRNNEHGTPHTNDHTEHENNDKESDEVVMEEEEEAIELTTIELIRSQLNIHPQLVHQVTTHGHVTALIAAVWVGSASLTELFLQHGAEVNGVDECGRSALWWAARFRRTNLTRLLLAHGADPNLKDNIAQHTPCHVAAAYHAVGVLQMLLEHSTKETFINAIDAAGFTPLHLTLLNSSSSSHVEHCVKLLVTHGADPTLQTRENKTVLHLLCERGGPASLVSFFLSHGVDADARDVAGYTALHRAVIANHALFLTYLLDKFEEYFQQQESTTSASSSKAPSQQHYNSYNLRFLINRATEPHGLTALHLAVIHQFVLRFLSLTSRFSFVHSLWNRFTLGM